MIQCEEISEEDEYINLQCQDCTYKAIRDIDIKLHILISHEGVHTLRSKFSSGMITYICEKCHFETTSDFGICSHMMELLGPGIFDVIIPPEYQPDMYRKIEKYSNKLVDKNMEVKPNDGKENKRKKIKRDNKKEEDEEEQPSNLMCNKCDFTTGKVIDLELHELLKHRDVDTLVSIKISNGVKVYVCNGCLFETPRDYNIWSHVISHKDTTTFKCSECRYEAVDRQSLESHLKCHERKNMIECDYCLYRTKITNHMLKHTCSSRKRSDSNSDDNRDNYQLTVYCKICHFKVNTMNNFAKHFQHHVTKNSKIYICGRCKYHTNNAYMFKVEHPLMHEAGLQECSLFKCSFCEYKGTNRRTFINHCKYCPFKQARSYYVKVYNQTIPCGSKRKSTFSSNTGKVD